MPLDAHKAMQWYKKASVQGHKFAQYNLACNYRMGIGVEANQEQAVRWYHFAAIQGYAPAQYEIGCAYQTGLCLKKDNKKAREWFQQAAEQNHAGALYKLGCLYENGDGVQADSVQAISYFLRAARLQQGGVCESAKQALLCYFNFACLWNGKQGVPLFPKAQWDELQLNLQNLKDVYPALEAYAGSGLGWGTANQNPSLQTLSHKIFSLITQYEELINNLKAKMIREPGFLINCVHFNCPQLKASFKQLGLYVRLDKDWPSYLDLSFSHEEVALLLKLMQSQELPQLISTLKHFYLSARNVLQELTRKGTNPQEHPFLLEGIFLALKASNPSAQTEVDLYSFLVAFLHPYMAGHGETEQINALHQAIKSLDQHLEDLDNHVEFAQSLNQEILELIRRSQSYRNHFFRVSVLNNAV
ncbi:tetratricopeptide repeat protein [Candidatus Odyssella thessalonicensis]|uniref:tetratricopeptide repeat protein n=1 Tax=Candidatus Odyssella thessalonicensis TaxID=84647 RepID=UPI000696DE01